MTIRHIVSVSGGKDSLATLLIAIERFGLAAVMAIFCDTGNEHELVYEYLGYLESALGIKIHRLKASFDDQIAAKRMFIARDKRTRRSYDTVVRKDAAGNIIYRMDNNGLPMLEPVWKSGVMDLVGVPKTKKANGKKTRWSNKAKRRALEFLKPTGNPYLDLCMWKGRFPSRKAQFCTEFLKRNPAVEFQLEVQEQGYTVVSWQGVRCDESAARRNAKPFEKLGADFYIYRPIAFWSAMDVFAYCASKGIKPNPLYMMGMNRVGCMPCINVAKSELREIASRFPDHISKIGEWEWFVAACSKRQAATFIPAPTRGKKITDQKAYAAKNDIYSVVEWSKTTRGGNQYDLLANLSESSGCSSSYGLCDNG